MNKYQLNLAALLLAWTAFSCKTTAPLVPSNSSDDIQIGYHQSDTSTVEDYHPSADRMNDLIHSSLKLQPDWDKKELNGQATLTLKPYFYPVTYLQLDAKGFDLHQVAMISDDDTLNLTYQYDDMKQLDIDLGQTFHRNDRYTIYIDYTARPQRLDSIGITGNDEKGIYFINPEGKDRNTPRQFWTQNETEFASCWFPTIDHPNERFTSEIYLTIDDYLTSLSNGALMGTENHENGFKTDHWMMAMELPAYLVLIAASDYAVVRDSWRGKEVAYYVDPKYKQYARDIFGRTPQMIDFFSDILDEPYPWPKYAQAVVHHFVSGAMENTSATIHFDGLQQTRREMLDGNQEDFISHELFHQWFGDMVTCESWANIPLNESFATYGEYLWIEHADGQMEADKHLNNDLLTYLGEAEHKQKPLIRYRYGRPDELFDGHSYQKGGRILHILRKYLGDDAFFGGLHLYLEQNKFQAVEWTQLRLAMEAVSGRDLIWFFNQWFLTPGHPVIDISYRYDDQADSTRVIIKQHSSMDNGFMHRLPIVVDMYRGDQKTRIPLDIKDSITIISCKGQPDLINVDAEKMLLCEKTDHKSEAAWMFQFRHAPLFMDKKEAMDALAFIQNESGKASPIFLEALNASYWGIRGMGLKSLMINKKSPDSVMKKVIALAESDPDARVRQAAISLLAELKDESLLPVFVKGLNDSSFSVESSCLFAIYSIDSVNAYNMASSFENSAGSDVLSTVAFIYSTMAGPEKKDFFIPAIEKNQGWQAFSLLTYYGSYLFRQLDPDLIGEAVDRLDGLYTTNPSWIIRYSVLGALAKVQNKVQLLEKEAEDASKQEWQKLSEKVSALMLKLNK